MCLLFETICINNGMPQHLSWHEERMNRARLEIWNVRIPVILDQLVQIPPEFSNGLSKCKIYYGPDIEQIIFNTYQKKNIRSLKLIKSPEFDYHLKYADRDMLESLFALRGDCDEVILVINGLITDTTISNLIFSDGKKWFTPAKPLLKGTCRNRLLAGGRIFEKDVHVDDLKKYTGCKLINAMRDPDEEMLIPVGEIC